LQIGAGDCDDKAILLAALLSSIGHRVRFIGVATVPNMYNHVWLQCLLQGRWIDLEPTEPVQLGERIPTERIYDALTCEL
jgi:transglutaminase-like putative cysteine protease